jgi:DNA-binding NtrC family response regulator
MSFPRLLIVDDNKNYAESLRRALQKEFSVASAIDKEEAHRALHSGSDVILLDIRLNDMDETNREGLELLREFRTQCPDVPVVMMTAYGDVGLAVQAMKEGASDFLQKPIDLAKLRATLSNALDRARLEERISSLQQDYARIEPGELVGQNPLVAEVRNLTQMVAQDGYVTVLIRGETGTGKELVARAIHRVGWRSKEPFVPMATASLSPSLIESELFGHEAGAFTGAKGRRIGFIEKAKRGVLFLDEIGDLPAEGQLKLLRFLEEKKFSRVGSSEEIEIDAQILAATNRNLEEAVGSGYIREDLYFRLKSVQIFLPPLRERRDDIPILADHFLRLFREQGRTRITEIKPEAAEALTQYRWPGNVRELKAALERAIIYANYNGHQWIQKGDLPLEILSASDRDNHVAYRAHIAGNGIDLAKEMARLELSYIEEALHSTEERKTEAWRLLGLNDRFALRRRTKALLSKYPSIAQQFPTVCRLYGKTKREHT